jgi:hypothetical protein
MKKYAILNPLNATYEYYDSLDTAKETLAKFAIDLYIHHHCHGNPISVVTINNDNSETWQSFTGDIILSPKQLEDILKNSISTITGIKKTIL